MASRSLLRSKALSGFLLLSMSWLCGQATAEEIIYRVKIKDLEFHLIGSVPFKDTEAPVDQNVLKLANAASALALEEDFLMPSKAMGKLALARKAAADMPAKAMPDALKAKFTKAMAAAGEMPTMVEQYLEGPLVDAALAIRKASAPFPPGTRPGGADSNFQFTALKKNKTLLPLLDGKEFYDSFLKIPRAAMEEYISLSADAILDPKKGAPWKEAHLRCYEAQRSQLPTPAHDVCTRDLIQKLKVPAPWQRGYYDARNGLLVDSMLAIAKKQDNLVVSLNHVHLGGPVGVLTLLKRRGAEFERIHGGPPQK